MGWASKYIEKLVSGEAVEFRPRGSSMEGRISSGDLVRVEPIVEIGVGDIVLCKVNGNEYLHIVKAVDGERYLIGNNRGGING